MDIKTLIERLKTTPRELDFKEVMEAIEAHYDYTPTAFTNGQGESRVINGAGENEGSCKVFAFGLMNGLSEAETLACFGEHYRHVLASPDGTDHANIRAFMRFGWSGVEFAGTALRPKPQ
jgi:hypothetical protein